jgi:polysaccharide deacetylase family protein (PEP-CTERM system associated)
MKELKLEPPDGDQTQSLRKPSSYRPDTRNVISVDVEDYFHAESFADVLQRSEWGSCLSRVEANTQRLLELFSRLRVQATFFVLGWVAERYPGLVREIAAGGHELGCHSYWHRLIYQLNSAEFREDTRKARDLVEQAAGQPVYGYRAPTYSIVSSSLWALEMLAELGFTYDSSIFPIHHDRYGIPDAPRFPFRISTASGPIVEYPITTFRLWGNNLPVAGGGYLRLLPWWYTRVGMRRARQEGLPVIAYVHPWEIDPEQPRLNGRFSSRLRHYTNLGKVYGRLGRMLGGGTFTSFRNSGLADIAQEVDFHGWTRCAR